MEILNTTNIYFFLILFVMWGGVSQWLRAESLNEASFRWTISLAEQSLLISSLWHHYLILSYLILSYLIISFSFLSCFTHTYSVIMGNSSPFGLHCSLLSIVMNSLALLFSILILPTYCKALLVLSFTTLSMNSTSLLQTLSLYLYIRHNLSLSHFSVSSPAEVSILHPFYSTPSH